MPAIVVAVASSAAGYAAAVGLGLSVTVAGVTSLTFAGSLVAAGVSMLASSVLSGAMGDEGGNQSSQASELSRGLLVNTSSSADPINVIYGSRRVGGTRVLTEVSGAGNMYLNLVICHCEGPVSAINEVYLDGIPSSDPKFSGLVTIEKHLGALDQVASAGLIAEIPGKWTTAHRGQGVAYTWVKLKFDQNVFRNIPTITADIDGKIVLDIRDDVEKFSTNPPLCIRDYLTNSLYGRGIPTTEIDTDSWISGANTCDVTYTDPDANDLPIHTCNGVLNTDQNSAENTRQLLTSCRGALIFSARGYGLFIDKAETPTTFEFNEDNIVGSWSISGGSKRRRFNRVRGNWFNPDREWQPDIWPADSEAFRLLDNGLLLEDQLALPFTSVSYEVQIKSERHLRQSRFGAAVGFKATIAGLECEVGDVVPITHSTPGFVSKPFRIQAIRLMSNDEVEIEATEYDDSVYSDTPLTTPRSSPVTNLPDPTVVAVPGAPQVEEQLYETTGSVGVRVKAIVTCGEAADIFVSDYRFEYKLLTDTDWIMLPKQQEPIIELHDLSPDIYQFRVRAENVRGAVSEYAAITTKELRGLSAPPSSVTGFSVRVVGGQAQVSLDKSIDKDVLIGGRVVIRWSPLTTGVTWNQGVLPSPDRYPGDSTSFNVPLLAGTYMAKFEDSTGHASSTEALFVVTEAAMTGFTTLATLTEDAAFTGTKTSIAVVSGGLQLGGATLVDSIPDFDAATTLDSLGGVSASGIYEFATGIDLGSVKTVKLFPSITSLAFDTGDLWDSRTDNIDDWGLIDGSVIEDAECALEVRVTDGDPAGSPTWGPWHPLPGQADYTTRGIQARLQMTSTNVTHNRIVTALSLTAKQPT